MSEAIVVAIISASVTLIGTIATVLMSSNKQKTAFTTQTALLEERIMRLKESVDTHNNFARRMPVVEEQIKVINHRIEELEKKEDELERKEAELMRLEAARGGAAE